MTPCRCCWKTGTYRSSFASVHPSATMKACRGSLGGVSGPSKESGCDKLPRDCLETHLKESRDSFGGVETRSKQLRNYLGGYIRSTPRHLRDCIEGAISRQFRKCLGVRLLTRLDSVPRLLRRCLESIPRHSRDSRDTPKVSRLFPNSFEGAPRHLQDYPERCRYDDLDAISQCTDSEVSCSRPSVDFCNNLFFSSWVQRAKFQALLHRT